MNEREEIKTMQYELEIMDCEKITCLIIKCHMFDEHLNLCN